LIIPIIPNTYNQMFNSAGYYLSGTAKGAGAGISGLSVKAYVPLLNGIPAGGVPTPEGNVSVPGISGIKGSTSRSDDNTGNGGVGPFVAFTPGVPTDSMGLVVSFTATLSPGDLLSLNGTLTIERQDVPEPGTLIPALSALGGVFLAARRRLPLNR
jgi:hypothetical protein